MQPSYKGCPIRTSYDIQSKYHMSTYIFYIFSLGGSLTLSLARAQRVSCFYFVIDQWKGQMSIYHCPKHLWLYRVARALLPPLPLTRPIDNQDHPVCFVSFVPGLLLADITQGILKGRQE